MERILADDMAIEKVEEEKRKRGNLSLYGIDGSLGLSLDLYLCLLNFDFTLDDYVLDGHEDGRELVLCVVEYVRRFG